MKDSDFLLNVEDQISEFGELGALYWLAKKISDDIIYGAVFYPKFLGFYAVGNKEVENVNVAGVPATRGPAVVAEPDCALIVLIYDGLVDLVPLSPQEVPRPDNLRQGVTEAH